MVVERRTQTTGTERIALNTGQHAFEDDGVKWEHSIPVHQTKQTSRLEESLLSQAAA